MEMENMVSLISVPYKSKIIKINKSNVSSFEMMENARRLRPGEIANLKQQLCSGIHFASPIVVNRIGNKFKVIDGNHRLQAIINWIKDSDNSIEVEFAVYEELDKEKEASVYRLWNRGTRQSVDDRIQVMRNDIPILQDIVDNRLFPVNVRIYPIRQSGIGLHFRTLMKGYYFSTRDWAFTANVAVFLEWLTKLDSTDAAKLEQFCKNYEEVFGKMGRDNIYSKASFLIPYMRVYFMNAKFQGTKNMIEKSKQQVFGCPQIMSNISLLGNIGDYSKMAQAICDALNKGKHNRNEMYEWRVLAP
jgi:hypothetical protein